MRSFMANSIHFKHITNDALFQVEN